MRFGLAVLALAAWVSGCSHTGNVDHGGASISVWHGEHQRVGHLGDAQDDFNLMGEVSGMAPPVEMLCLANNAAIPLNVGAREDGWGNGRRLARTGHFNADIPVQNLMPGENRVWLTARGADGKRAVASAVVERLRGESPLPARIEWSELRHPQDAGQIVDGHWAIGERGIRTQHTGYDRIFLIGEKSWRDYDITVPVTIHGIDTPTGPVSGGNGVGILFRFAGHVEGGHRGFPPSQPKWGYQPFGAIAWLRWDRDNPSAPPAIQFYRGDNDNRENYGTFSVAPGETVWMRGRCETPPDSPDGSGVTRYSFKLWRDGEPEPNEWAFQHVQTSEHANRTGGVALLAHHVDASFGDLAVQPVGGAPER